MGSYVASTSHTRSIQLWLSSFDTQAAHAISMARRNEREAEASTGFRMGMQRGVCNVNLNTHVLYKGYINIYTERTEQSRGKKGTRNACDLCRSAGLQVRTRS